MMMGQVYDAELSRQAIERVRQMQERAARTVLESNGEVDGFASVRTEAADTQAQQRHNVNSRPVNQQTSGGNSILDSLFGGSGMQGNGNARSNDNAAGPKVANNAGYSRPQGGKKGGGLLDLINSLGGKNSAGSLKGLGDTVRSTLSSTAAPLNNLLDYFDIDGEKLIILLVMWLIFSERSEDKTLLLALGYILL